MSLVVADTSALVSLGTVLDSEPDPLGTLLETHTVLVPERVVEELEDTAEFDDRSGTAATAVLDRTSEVETESTELDESFPLDDGENAAVTLANDSDAEQLLCDEFNRLALVHASLDGPRLSTTPTLLVSFVRNDELDAEAAVATLDEIADARSWSSNTYVERARSNLGS